MIVSTKKQKDNQIIKKSNPLMKIKKHKRLLQNHQFKSQLGQIVIIKKSSQLIKIIVLSLHQKIQIKRITIRALQFNHLM